MSPQRLHLIGATALLLAAHPAASQSPVRPPSTDQSAAELHRLVSGLTVTPRVLIVGMHPDDEDTQLIAWLSRGHNVETAYLSVTRGEAGLNFGGEEAGTSLGALRTEEALAGRRIDGAHQFYTRAFDFGAARNIADVLKHWNRDSLVGDIVGVMRAFRPHVVIAVFSDSFADNDGQDQALGLFVDQAFASSADPRRFPPAVFGMPWPAAKLYRYGTGLRIETAGYDRVLGKTYAELAIESRAQQRSQGLAGLTAARSTAAELRRIGSRVGDSAAVDESLFAAVDTSFARLAARLPVEARGNISSIAANADSARRAFGSSSPSAAVPYLARVATFAGRARAATPWCQHASAAADPPAASLVICDPPALDLEASIDLVRDRSTAALLAASGISFEATADRELLATSDSTDVTVTMFNRGTRPATLQAIDVWGSHLTPMESIEVSPDSSVRIVRRVSRLADAHPWWSGPHGGPERGGDRFDEVPSAVDGLARGGLLPRPFKVLGVAVPEDIRRTSNVSVTVKVANATLAANIGPVIYRHADAEVGLQNRPLGGIPDVTLQFARGLEWIPRNKPLTRSLRIAVKSHSDRELEVGLNVVTPMGMPKGIRVDSLPPFLRLAPHEERELLVQLRGKPVETDRLPLAVIGARRAQTPGQNVFTLSTSYQTGLQTIHRAYLPPIHVMPASGEWIQPIDIDVPPALTVLYVPGVSDAVASALRQVGVWVSEATTADQLLSVDLSKVTSIAIGAQAFDVHPELLGQTARLIEFVRNGGTLVVLRGGEATASSRLFPYPLSLAHSAPERVLQPDAPVTVLDAKARVLSWPNKIGAADWAEWVAGRSQSMPTAADPRYARVVEVHDVDQPENRNAILVAHVGKGTLVYTTLTLDRQIAGGIPGGLRLLVNLLSAGLPAAR
ncbi:MAG: LmbE family protein [Gemmatimonadetes bacterium]|nr:LmbE family protein [Gemmatimonadota bacterium]